MIPILTPEQMAAVDAAAPVPVSELIHRAGGAVARAAIELLGGVYGRTVAVIAGHGNNGNDGRVAGELLARRGVHVTVFDAASCPGVLPAVDLVIDAAYGTGFRGDWTAPDVGGALVVAVDSPSGVAALTGHAGQGVLRADETVTFQALKPGLVMGDGASLSGAVRVVDIGLDVSGADQHLVEAADVAAWWPVRHPDAHKWRHAVRVVAGSAGMLGAARLCAESAARAGAGLVKLSVPGGTASVRPEIVQELVGAEQWSEAVLADIARFGSLVIGPGLGRAEATITSIRSTIEDATVPVVIDGDALFAAAWDALGAKPLFENRGLPTVLTPHDGEFSLLTGSRPADDRIASARALAGDLGCTVLLKGPATIVADPDGEVLVVDHGDRRLATAGSGDVLAGMIGAALAAGVPPRRAPAAAAWLHAEAARCGPNEGMLAGDLIDAIPTALAGVR